MTNGTELRMKLNIFDIIEDYDKKVEDLPGLFKEVNSLCKVIENKCSTMGVFGDAVFQHSFEYNRVDKALHALKVSAWRYVYQELNVKHLAPASHAWKFKKLFEEPPEFTSDAIRSIFKDYVQDPRGMILKAFAEIFNTLDKFYKSHSNMRVGVKGLPKRVIIGGCGEYMSSYGHTRVADVINCLMRYRGHYDKCVHHYNLDRKPEVVEGEEPKLSVYDGGHEGLTFKRFANGNIHVIFDKLAMNDINKALAEYYGDVLPDVYEHAEQKQASKEVSKDLQFYGTPEKTVNNMLDEIHIPDGAKVLEPSCGDGAIMQGIRERTLNRNVSLTGVEYDTARYIEARNKGFHVYNDNFLEWQTEERFDYIIMNPPFYGKHYAKHIEKAYSLLAEGGRIMSILPITAQMDHGILDAKYDFCRWKSLPMGSFTESGTNINTVVVTIFK